MHVLFIKLKYFIQKYYVKILLYGNMKFFHKILHKLKTFIEIKNVVQMDKIEQFIGDFRFLSNFFPVEVEYDGHVYKSVEHAYQAAKTLDDNIRKTIREAETASKAKKIGKNITLREDWNDVKIDIMESLLREKFSKQLFKQLLKNTGDAELIEGNTWGDDFWGVYNNYGHNHLGKLLMKIRNEFK